jgi:release factor glutamine methyltransferase
MKMSIGNALSEGAQVLGAAGIFEARMEAMFLISRVLGRDRTFVFAHPEVPLTDDELQAFRQFVARRAAGEPFQHITGHQEFFKFDFEVTPDVLVPRPETELIVEAALDVLGNDQAPVIADIGTGSGCIVISLLHEISHARAVGTDISLKALGVARRNAERHGVIDRLALVQADSLSAFEIRPRFSIVVANPPYIRADEISSLQREVRDHEPLAALVSGADGLSHIRTLVRDAPSFLLIGGYLVFEIGNGQRAAVEKMIDLDVWKLIEIRNDLQNIPRTVVLRKRYATGD